MKQYKITTIESGTYWQKNYYVIDAESEEDAIDQYNNGAEIDNITDFQNDMEKETIDSIEVL